MSKKNTDAAQRPPANMHPRALAPGNLILTLALSAIGAIVGIQVLTTLGITPSTSIIGALVAMSLARVPLVLFKGFRSIHAQNLAQTSISSATFGAANSLILPIGIPFVFGLPNMVLPMLIGVSCALLLDAYMLYRMYATPAFPADDPWPLGVAAAEAIKAGDEGGIRAKVLLGGIGVGIIGAIFSLPMSGLGIALIAGLGSMVAFAVGLLISQYALPLTGWDLAADYVPHGVMIGAGIVALVQVMIIVIRGFRRRTDSVVPTDDRPVAAESSAVPPTARDAGASGGRGILRRLISSNSDGTVSQATQLGRTLRTGSIGFGIITLILAFGTGVYTQMSVPMLIGFVLFAAAAAFVHEIIVGIAAMRAGYFPAFAVALITLIIGIVIGFPPEALVVLAGFNATTGPAFADMGYDFKAGYMLRGSGKDPEFEREGRRQQMIAGMLGFGVAIVVVAITYNGLFAKGQFAPINEAYVAVINAGISTDTAMMLLVWAIPGVLLQMIGGARRQLGILLATGLLLSAPFLGWLVAAGIIVRLICIKAMGDSTAKRYLEILGGGIIAGDAIYSFGNGLFQSARA